MASPGPIVYLAGELPKLSETFVYREILTLRSMGVRVMPASVHHPKMHAGTPELDALAAEAIGVYGPGAGAMIRDVGAELIRHPVRTLSVMLCGGVDALAARDVRMASRPKVLVQMLGGIALAHRLRAHRPAHIHAHFAHVPTTIAMYAATQLGIGFSFTGHANDLFQQRTMLTRKLRRARFVSCISQWHRQWYRSITPIGEDRLPVIRCGVDIDDFTPGTPTPRTVVSVARLVEKKGLDTLIEAIGLLRDRALDCTCVIGGDGPMMDELRAMVDRLNLSDRVELPGAMPNDRVRALVSGASVFCLPCRDDQSGDRDGIPVALMEAMACGVATVSGDLPAIRELIEDGISGRLVPGGDAGACADALEELLTDESKRTELGKGGRKRVEQEFSSTITGDRLIAAFRSCGALES
ncbi:MAG TPA: colanic acid biosynthesis glycosyltransferase WcaL [Phycisphaerales bacterium]|nr:colanic acid biosynthesis glycosyltransferase WcaL [Phycisphaerales bacterium]